MRLASVNATTGEVRTPESLLIARERAAFRQRILDEVIAGVSDYLRLVIHARFMLSWSQEKVAAEFRLEQSTIQRAEMRALQIMRQQLAARGVKQLTDIL